VPLITGKIFDAIIKIAQNPLVPLTGILTLIVIWALLQFASNGIGWWTGFQNDKLSTVLQADYTANGFSKLFEMPLSFHTTQKQGDVSDRISRASNWLDSIVGNVLLSLLPSFLSIFVALVITLFINWHLTLILIAAIIIYAAVLWAAVPRLVGLQKKMHRAYNDAYGDAHDALGNIREIKQAATEKLEQKKIRNNFVTRAAAFWVDMNTIFQRLTFIQKMLVSLTQLSIFVLSVFYVQHGTITPGELVAFNGYAAMMLGPFISLGQQWQTIQNGIVAIVRAENIITLPTETYVPKNAVAPEKLTGEVIFDNVSFGYKKGDEILKNISFRVKPGEKVALVGESGVGKTTIIDLLSGFYFPQEGRITIDGTDIKKMDLTKYRSHIGVVPQEPALFNDTIESNIRYGNPKRSNKEMIDAAKEAYANDFIETFPKKYKTIVGWRGIKLSIGQKQRIALARAFLRNPDILVLDEPTSALDARSEELVKVSFRKLMAGRTSFIIAHRLSTVREADKILVLKDGGVVEMGSHAELVKLPAGVYRSLYELQTGFIAK
jgi:ABC-type multidrug transport system fused ATPase/permease subunit